jgi:tetratricopeptide (TPR) repeat protein
MGKADARFIVRFTAKGFPTMEWSRTLDEIAKADPCPEMALQQAPREGNAPKARRLYEIAFKAYAEDPYVINGLAWGLATWPKDSADPVRAVELARKAVALTQRRDANLIDTFAEALLRAGKPAEAQTENEALLKVQPTHAKAKERAARIRAASEKAGR